MELGIYILGPNGYVLAPPDAGGWSESQFLGRWCRLRRHSVRDLGFTYELELSHRSPGLRRRRSPRTRTERP